MRIIVTQMIFMDVQRIIRFHQAKELTNCYYEPDLMRTHILQAIILFINIMQRQAVTRPTKDKQAITSKTQRWTQRVSSSKPIRATSKKRIVSHPDQDPRCFNKTKNKNPQLKNNIKTRASSSKIIRSHASERSFKSEKAKSKEKDRKIALKEKYMEIVEKIFRRIDFFGYGWIDSQSINKWIHPKVLYFFGTIFHLIKTKNLRMQKNQFMNEAKIVFLKSSVDDIKNFIDGICLDSNFDNQIIDTQQQVPYTRGAAAVTQAAAQRKKLPPMLYDLDYQVNYDTKQAVTPLFSDSSLKAKDLNRPTFNIQPNTTKNDRFQRYPYREGRKDMDFYSSPDHKTRTLDWQSQQNPSPSPQTRTLEPASQHSKLLAESRRRLDDSKLGRLKERLDYFIQKNSEHLHVSQYVRLQNGF